ncbi:anti-sigma factor antagonist [Micromonospora sp. KC606]|uniref:STAS domain-containing protein n=1 Tax=Micromonospora sp. KC606 TaxID=2530379 RepID=UPI0010477C3E|nr:STAS domain-containing protein [Micromonospora sp. KC606]TDC81351.1 anti-sigma factor antagonist [Micromonospora sp. KC606]
MTVVPTEHLMTLICDDCGDSVTSAGLVLPDAEVVWTLVFDNGFTGSPFAAGPHRCARCDLHRVAVDDGAAPPRATEPRGTGFLDRDERVAEAGDLTDAVRRALAEAVTVDTRVLVDLGEAPVVDSASLGLLVRAYREARRDGRQLCLVAPSRFVLTVLHTMRLETVFPVFPTHRDAVRGHRPGQPRPGTPVEAVAP